MGSVPDSKIYMCIYFFDLAVSLSLQSPVCSLDIEWV